MQYKFRVSELKNTIFFVYIQLIVNLIYLMLSLCTEAIISEDTQNTHTHIHRIKCVYVCMCIYNQLPTRNKIFSLILLKSSTLMVVVLSVLLFGWCLSSCLVGVLTHVCTSWVTDIDCSKRRNRNKRPCRGGGQQGTSDQLNQGSTSESTT